MIFGMQHNCCTQACCSAQQHVFSWLRGALEACSSYFYRLCFRHGFLHHFVSERDATLELSINLTSPNFRVSVRPPDSQFWQHHKNIAGRFSHFIRDPLAVLGSEISSNLLPVLFCNSTFSPLHSCHRKTILPTRETIFGVMNSTVWIARDKEEMLCWLTTLHNFYLSTSNKSQSN